MNAQQLRNSILQQAIQGKLVAQDPDDEPASVLLQRIRKEKEHLVKEGRLKKKDLESKPIEEDEIPFEIPESWEWCRIKNVFSMQAGKNITANNIHEEKTEEFKYLCYGGNGVRGYVKNYNTKGNYVLVGRQGALCGNVQLANGQFYATEHAVVTDGYGLTDLKWSYYFLTALNLNKYATATAQPGLAVSNIIEVLLPLPPLAEQRRIVAKIEELMPLVERYGKAQNELDKLNESLPARLRQSILQEAIQGRLVPQDSKEEPASELLKRIRKEKEQLVKEGKLKKKDLESKPIEEDEIPFEIPESWEWVRFSVVMVFNPRNVCEDGVDAGYIPMAYIEPDLRNEFKYDVKKWKDVKNGLTHLADGDVVFAKITPCITNMKSAIMKGLPNGVAGGTTELNVFRVVGETMDRKYILYFHASPYFMNDAVYKGTAGQQRIVSNYILDKPFPLPPLSEQKRIVAKIEELFGVMG